MSAGPTIPWIDLYSRLAEPRQRELRRANKERLAELEAQGAERRARLKAAERARQAEKDRWP